MWESLMTQKNDSELRVNNNLLAHINRKCHTQFDMGERYNYILRRWKMLNRNKMFKIFRCLVIISFMNL